MNATTIADGVAVGFVHAGGASDEGRASAAWLAERVGSVTHLGLTDLADADVDVAWWHREAPIERLRRRGGGG
jgi:hypothetical protein